MPKKDIFDYGLTDRSEPADTRFGTMTFTKAKTLHSVQDNQGETIRQEFLHWTMVDYFRAIVAFRGCDWEEREGGCNLIGLREMNTDYQRIPRKQGEFNDLLVVVKEGKTPEIYVFECTIDPGGKRADDPAGQLLLASNVHRAMLGKGTHGGQTGDVLVLVQMSYFRDKDMDGYPDDIKALEQGGESQGVHIHWSSKKSKEVKTWSTGCSVLHYGYSDSEYSEFISLMKDHATKYGRREVQSEMPMDKPIIYDIDYIVTTSAEFKTPAEILKLDTFYDLLGNIKRNDQGKGLQECPNRSVIYVASYILEEMRTNLKGPDVAQIREWLRPSLDVWQNMEAPVSGFWAAIGRWIALVRPGGQWDHKKKIRSTYGEFACVQDNLTLYRFDIWSNIHYGYIGLACGFDEGLLKAGAGGAQALGGAKNIPGGYWKRPGVLAALDDPKDQAAIQLGFDLWKGFHDDITLTDLLSMVEERVTALATKKCELSCVPP